MNKKAMKTFEELGVSAEIRRAIEEMGFVQPMPVQEEVIPYLLGEGNEVIALAQTGTGKTAVFTHLFHPFAAAYRGHNSPRHLARDPYSRTRR